MADEKKRFEDTRDKFNGEIKAGYGKVTKDRLKEFEGNFESKSADTKSRARDFGDKVKEKTGHLSDEAKGEFDHLKEKMHHKKDEN